jgi:hypothetical protein
VSLREVALWALVIAVIYLAVRICLFLWDAERPTDWDAPADDLDNVDPAEAQHWDHDRPAPVIWSNHGRPGGWICAAPHLDMPSEICGWPQTHDPCPSHGPLLVPEGWTGGAP